MGDPITPIVLAKTIAFQIGLLGAGTMILSLFIAPQLAKRQGMHQMTDKERESISKTPILGLFFGKASRWYDHVWWSLLSTGIKATAFIFVFFTFFIVLTDVGWADATGNALQIFLSARASGQPNGAHLPSYIAVASLGVYSAWRFRSGKQLVDMDWFFAVLFVGFTVGMHELPWLAFYLLRYYGQLHLFLGANFIEDAFFGVMCILLIVAFWRYPFRKVEMRRFAFPMVAYLGYLTAWFAWGLPVTTINNFQIGKGPFEMTQWWADPLVNAVEIGGWLLITATFFWVIHSWRYERQS